MTTGTSLYPSLGPTVPLTLYPAAESPLSLLSVEIQSGLNQMHLNYQNLNGNQGFFSPLFFKAQDCTEPLNNNFVFAPLVSEYHYHTLKYCSNHCLDGFNPWQTNTGHVIHIQIIDMIPSIAQQLQTLDPSQRIAFLEQVVFEISSVSFQPEKQELLEIAARYHFWGLLTSLYRQEIGSQPDSNLPADFETRSQELIQFLTRNNYFKISSELPISILYPLPANFPEQVKGMAAIAPPADQNLDGTIQAFNDHIDSCLNNYGLINNSTCWNFVDQCLRYELSMILANGVVANLRPLFEKKELNAETAFDVIGKIQSFLSRNGSFSINSYLKEYMVSQLLAIDLQSADCFGQLMGKIDQEKQQALLPKKTKFLGLFSRESVLSTQESQKVTDTFGKQMQFIQDMQSFLQRPIESAPAFDAEDVQLYPNLVDINANHNHSFEEISAEERSDIEALLEQTIATIDDFFPQELNEFVHGNSYSAISQQIEETIENFTEETTTTTTTTPVEVRPEQARSYAVASYIDLAFPNIMNLTNPGDIWSHLPEINKLDVLRHVVCLRKEGKAENAARILLPSVDKMQQRITQIKYSISSSPAPISKEVREKGEAVLHCYYGNFDLARLNRLFNEFPKDGKFFEMVYFQAKAAGIEIPDWDHGFAANNWNRPDVFFHSLQALERYLHTDHS